MNNGITRNDDEDVLQQKHNYTAEEIHWIESESLFSIGTSVRGEEDRGANAVDTEDNDDVDLNLDNLFVDPDPYETFTLQWKILYMNDCDSESYNNEITALNPPVKDSSKNNNSNVAVEETTAQITVIGNKAENGQTLHSTGLTLWRASRLLTDYLVAIHNQNTVFILRQQQEQQQQQQPSNNSFQLSSSSSAGAAASSTSQCPNPIAGIFPYFHSHHNDINNPTGSKIDCSNKNNRKTIAVLELGCGLGIPTMLYHYYLSSLSTTTITIATDADIQTLQNLRQNLMQVHNEQECLFSLNDNTRRRNEANKNIMTCQQLIWGNPVHIQRVLQTLQSHHYKSSINNNNSTDGTKQDCCIDSLTPPKTLSETRICSDDNDRNNHVKKFDIILGSDIIYVEHVVEPLFRTVHELLNNNTDEKESGVFLLAFARRNVSIDYVLKIAQQQGFIYEYKEISTMIMEQLPSVSSIETIITENTPRTTTTNSATMEGVYVFRLQKR